MVIDKIESIKEIVKNGSTYFRIIGKANGEPDKKAILDIAKNDLTSALYGKKADEPVGLSDAAVKSLKTGPHASFKFDILTEEGCLFSSTSSGLDDCPDKDEELTRKITLFIPSPEDWYPELGIDLALYLANRYIFGKKIGLTLVVNGYCIISDQWVSGNLFTGHVECGETPDVLISNLEKLMDICKSFDSYSDHIANNFMRRNLVRVSRGNNLATRILNDFLSF